MILVFINQTSKAKENKEKNNKIKKTNIKSRPFQANKENREMRQSDSNKN